MILTEGKIARNGKWLGIAFIGKNRMSQVLFAGCQSTRNKDINITKALVVREATIEAVKLGFQKIIVLTQSKDIKNIWRNHSKYRWQISPIFEDLKCL